MHQILKTISKVLTDQKKNGIMYSQFGVGPLL